MKPRCRTAGGVQQLRYQLPYDITSSAVYPLLASNGSSVVVCGHATGLFITWRNGRRLKSAKQSSDNDPSQDVVALDGNKKELTSLDDVTLAEFQDEEEEYDPQDPFPPIVQTLDLSLGTGVLHISTPQLSQAERRHLRPEFLRNQMLVTVACADATLRVLTIPLDPPSNSSKLRKGSVAEPLLGVPGKGRWGEQQITIDAGDGHRSLATSISVAIAPRSLVVEAESYEWDVLVASGSADIGGTLLIHRIAVEEDGLSLTADSTELWRSELLDNPPTSLDLYVGPDITAASYPKVLVAEADRPVRLFECSSEDSLEESSWIAEMQPSSTHDSRVLSLRFGMAGRLAVALTETGEWGVWDLSTLKEDATAGGMPTIGSFSYGDSLASPASTSLSRNSGSQSLSMQSIPAVTPHTRKVRQDALFGGHETRSSLHQGTSAPPTSRGNIVLTKTTHESGVGEDAAMLVWYNERAIFIHSLRAHHSSRVTTNTKDPFNTRTNAGAQIKVLSVPDRTALNGGAQVDIWPLNITGRAPSIRSKAPESVYISERAITFVGQAPTDENIQNTNAAKTGNVSNPRLDRGLNGLLKHGELNLDGVEGMLDRMAGSVKRLSGHV